MISIKAQQDIQGLVFSGYDHLDEAVYLFIHFDDRKAAKLWLQGLIPDITHGAWKNGEVTTKPAGGINFALTYKGLKALGYPQLDRFPGEFITGMADPERSRRLGDIGESAPGEWDIGGPKHEDIHALLILQAKTRGDLSTTQKQYVPAAGVHLCYEQSGSAMPDDKEHFGKEHFGFTDGISQPEIEGSPRLKEDTPPGADIVPTGEFILGYKNAYGQFPSTPTVDPLDDPYKDLPPAAGTTVSEKDFGNNGTYLVFRKLQQDVAAFRRFVREKASPPDLTMAQVAAKMVGRWPSGAPVVLSPTRDPLPPSDPNRRPTNDFGYHVADADGLACPIGAHIRRANPRDDLEHDPEESIKAVQRHRIMRRGILYGPRLLPEERVEDDGKERGLLFVCINADIRRQFEFVQQTWLNNPKFAGLFDDRDPLVGQGDAFMTIQEKPLRRRLANLPRFVTVKGGEYFFLPGIKALRYLSH